ncbi:MAG: hypothetical protein QM744_14460 [Mesorhizobium sp.]
MPIAKRIKEEQPAATNVAIAKAVLKQGDNGYSGGDIVAESQIELWPTAEHRALVRDIGRARVHVPSKGEFVEVDPTKISRAELKEAGQFLKRQAADQDLRGDRCIELAGLGGW